MGGLILFFVVGLWVVLVVWLSKVVATRIPAERWRLPVGLLVFSVLAPLPILDELVGARQFERLCQENFTIKVDRATAVGRTVYLNPTPSFVVEGTWVPIIVQPWRYVDVTTGETVLSYNTLRAKGGRFLKVSEGQVPITFKGSCEPTGVPYSIETFKVFGINYIEPPITRSGERK
ncbi:MAG TPA: hypothetical protein PLX65_14305 [Accumulibacter sp.]|nr:hypothetical protein [Accumulibacter sp.]